MSVVFEQNESGQLCVQVNPVSGRIYGFFYDYPVFQSQVPDPNVIIVRVDTTAENFANELAKGLFYKSGVFIRPVKFDRPAYSLIIGQPLNFSIELPEAVAEPEFCRVELKTSGGELIDSLNVFLTDKLSSLSMLPTNIPTVEPLKLFASTSNFGTCSAQVFVMTRQDIESAKIQIATFEKSIPAEEIINQDKMEEVLSKVANVNIEDVAKIIEESAVENKEAFVKLVRAQLRNSNINKQSMLGKLLRFIKGESNE
ncbi:MAG: hypothetical protein QXE80_03420 [Pyrobaculum sp.]